MSVDAKAPGRAATTGSRARRPVAARRSPGIRSLSRPAWVVYWLSGAAVVALLHAWRGESYWLYSEGVYLATAREVASGAALYGDVAAAHPPTMFVLGAALLEASDSLLFIRGSLAATTLVTGALVALVVARLTGRRGAAVAAGLVALLAPWTIREHATLTPEPLAAAPLLAAALLAARTPRWSGALAGALAALAATFKLAFLLPAAAVWLAARRRSAYLTGGLMAGGALALGSLLVWGPQVWDNVVAAQRETGVQLDRLPGLVGQSAWNLGPLVALGALAYLGRRRARDPALLRAVGALGIGSLALVVSFLKEGTYLNTLALIEPPAVALAAVGLVWFVEDSAMLRRRRRLATAGVALGCAFFAAQSASLLVMPSNPQPFGNPFLSRAPGYQLSQGQVDHAAAAARACPPDAPYSGSPFVAFVADRPLPGGQPDRFIVGEASTHADLRAAVASDRPLCPYRSLGGSPTGSRLSGPSK